MSNKTALQSEMDQKQALEDRGTLILRATILAPFILATVLTVIITFFYKKDASSVFTFAVMGWGFIEAIMARRTVKMMID